MIRFTAFVLLAIAPATAAANKVFNEGTGGTVDCAKDASTVINTNDGAYTFTGKCTAVTVNGNNNKLTFEDVTALTVNGNNNAATTSGIDKLSVNGNDNNVTWAKALTGPKPKVSTLGNHNKVAQGGAAKTQTK